MMAWTGLVVGSGTGEAVVCAKWSHQKSKGSLLQRSWCWLYTHPKFHIALAKMITLPETNSSHPKMDGWKTILSYWEGDFSGTMWNFRWAITLISLPFFSSTFALFKMAKEELWVAGWCLWETKKCGTRFLRWRWCWACWPLVRTYDKFECITPATSEVLTPQKVQEST